tara:strand:- start:5019 stop:5471 length:453 start_codon:yes stop_codon:yes gene_type:complete
MEISFPDKTSNILIACLIIFDFLWFSFSLKRIYPKLDTDIRYAVFSWILIGLAVSAGKYTSVQEAIVYGSSLGLLIYGVFNSTEAALRKDWRNPQIYISDTLWGIFICSLMSCICYVVRTLNDTILYPMIGLSIFFYTSIILWIQFKLLQ